MENSEAIPSANVVALLKEYYEILKIVGDFDGRLMTVKGWGVTLSLAALGLGFQYGRYGLFLVASLSITTLSTMDRASGSLPPRNRRSFLST